MVTNQTTLSILDVKDIVAALKIKYPNLIFKNDICYATYDRQTAVLDLKDENVDLLIVVGDQKSNNSNKLQKIGKEIAKNSILIQDSTQINHELIQQSHTIALTSGASTPTQITKQVSDKLKEIMELVN